MTKAQQVFEAITAIKQDLAAPVQEPVPWSQALESVWAEPDDTPPAAQPAPVQPATFPKGYALHELPADYTGKLWIEGQVRYLHRLTAAQPAPEQYTALEQALTRLQKRYGELEAKAAVLLRCWLTDEQKLDVVADYFDHVDGDWAVKKASQLLDAYESKLKELNT